MKIVNIWHVGHIKLPCLAPLQDFYLFVGFKIIHCALFPLLVTRDPVNMTSRERIGRHVRVRDVT